MSLTHSKKVISLRYFLLLLLFVSGLKSYSQFVLTQNNSFDEVSLHPYASLLRAGDELLTLEDVQQRDASQFESLPNSATDLGFTNNHYWLRFSIQNATSAEQVLFLEACRPIVDVAVLYELSSDSVVSKQLSGDAIPFKQRSFENRKVIFKLVLKPNTTLDYYLHLKSDGEAINAGLMLRTFENLMGSEAFEQLIFGIFYGILLIAGIIYLFFFFALGERSFLYYSLYVLFIGLLQFSLDGMFYQFITPQSGWLSLNAVILSACIANFFLGRYAQVFLKIKLYSKFINQAFYVIFVLDFLLLLSLIVHPSALQYSYPLANILGLMLLMLIIASIVVIYFKTQKIDRFFAIGIFFLIAGFVVFILKNFSVLPVTFWTENGSKLGTGMEVIFLSLSMANLIRKLRNEREAMQSLALQKSEEMNEMKTYFLSNISHELRTPLNAILNLSKEISKDAKDDSIQKNSLLIKDSSYNLLSSVNDILDFSKIEKGEIKLDEGLFLLRPLFEHLAKNMANRAESQELRFSFSIADDVPQQVLGDKVRLTQILYNIISNALKFTAEGSVAISITSKLKKDDFFDLIISVKDTGVGISKEKLNAVFDSFSQENITNKRKYGGLGLGLFIVKHLADLHQGSVDLKSEVNQGTTCTVTLQMKAVALDEPTLSAPAATDYDLKGKRILVAEDNAMNQMVLKMITKKWLNTEVIFTANGQECLEALSQSHFDIVLMDLQMPVMDGYEATIAIRKGEAGNQNAAIPIIAVTADIMETTKIRVVEIGMNNYISKPLDKELLFKMIEEVLF